jgi:hypothetical protein
VDKCCGQIMFHGHLDIKGPTSPSVCQSRCVQVPSIAPRRASLISTRKLRTVRAGNVVTGMVVDKGLGASESCSVSPFMTACFNTQESSCGVRRKKNGLPAGRRPTRASGIVCGAACSANSPELEWLPASNFQLRSRMSPWKQPAAGHCGVVEIA